MKVNKITAGIFFNIILTLILLLFRQTLIAEECECAKNGDDIASEYDENRILYDIYGSEVSFDKVPERIISLVPAITEMIEAVDPEYKLKGVTSYDSKFNTASEAEIVGGFYSPDLHRIKNLNPEIIIAASLHAEIHNEFRDSDVHVIILDAHNAEGIYRNLEIIGRIFHHRENAEKAIKDIKDRIDNIQNKLSIVPKNKRKRVMRLMGFDGKNIYTPGDDSFQTEAIRLAGGIPIMTGRRGQITHVEPGQWKDFNPQVLYSCGNPQKMWKSISEIKPWKDADAVKYRRHLIFDCNYTCRPSVNYGRFIELLSSKLYKEFYFTNSPLKKDGYGRERKIDINTSYIKDVSVKYGTIDDFEHKTLIIKFNKELDVLSTLMGWEKVKAVGNHFLSMPRWDYGHAETLEEQEKKICNAVGIDDKSASLLITGADMDNLAVVKKSYKKYDVYALITAGVMGNAQRQAKDSGFFYPHGTINMIILTNTKLSGGAMGRAIISATEAKMAALQDLDIRSSYTPVDNQATGTGTDNIIVISGEGLDVDSSGGHTKMGELIARAVYEGALEAVRMQNRTVIKRNIYERLDDRKISITELLSYTNEKFPADKVKVIKEKLENILFDVNVVQYLESAFAVTDAYKRNKLSGNSLFNNWSIDIAEKISGKNIKKLIKVNIDADKNSPLNTAFSAILTGVIYSFE